MKMSHINPPKMFIVSLSNATTVATVYRKYMQKVSYITRYWLAPSTLALITTKCFLLHCVYAEMNSHDFI